jgi:iron-sulfur cluster protein
MHSPQPTTLAEESPRAVANKSSKDRFLRAIRMALRIESAALQRNTRTFNRNRYRAVGNLPDYNALKDEARAIKERSIAQQPELLERLQRAVQGRGGHFYLAPKAEDACRYIRDVCVRHGAKLVVKGKSMTSEEIHLNRALEDAGIEVAETDLAEFILQVAGEQPSHIIAPAVHYTRERITELFKRKFHTDEALDTGEELTRFARERLRQKFLHADVGISGANLIAADDATLMLVESEGNIRMSTTLPPVHIAVAGVEKVIPSRAEMGVFVELLAASGTGQSMSVYTSIVAPPLKSPAFALEGREKRAQEFHLVLVDNGRLRMREDPVLKETLYCIRCSACLNSCANFQTVGGHAFGGETYSGGIGGAWEAGTGRLENARFSELCTGCSRCVPQCPVRIDIPWLNESLRERLNQLEKPSLAGTAIALLAGAPRADRRAPLEKQFFGNYHFFASWGARLAPLSNRLLRLPLSRALMERVFGVDRRRALPPFPEKPLLPQLAREWKRTGTNRGATAEAILFADVYTSYGHADIGIATLDVLEALGVQATVTDVLPDGRAALSQGMIASARHQARKVAEALSLHIGQGKAIVVLEPSALALFRRDYAHLLDNAALFAKLRDNSYEPVEYVSKILRDQRSDPRRFFDGTRASAGTKVFYHSHCQQRTVGSAAATEELLRSVGFDVITSSVECCGMAGSFGYKKDYYELSMAVGQELFSQVAAAEKDGPRTLLASGTSCREQLQAGLGRHALHPIQLLASCLAPHP